MRKLNGPVVGLSLTGDTVRAVVVERGRSGDLEVTDAAAIPIPPGVFEDRVLTYPEPLSRVIRELLGKSGIKARNAVVGLPSWAVFARVVNIPPVPDKERQSVVRGEIDHLGILPPGQGTFDFEMLARPTRSSDTTTNAKGDPILFFATEQNVVENFRLAVTEAGLRVVGMEPEDYAAIRVAYLGLASKPIAVAISLGDTHTHMQFFQHGKTIYARRLDVGIDQLTSDIAPTPAVASGGWTTIGQAPSGGATATAEETGEEPTGHAEAARQRLVSEIARSLEYFSRQYGVELTGLHVALLPNDVSLAGLSVYATAALEQEIEFANAFQHTRLGSRLPSRLRQEDGVAYAPALGLALGPLVSATSDMPVFDLSADVIAAARNREAARFALASAIGAVAIASAGAGFMVALDQLHKPLQNDLFQERGKLQMLVQEEARLQANFTQQQDLVRQIRSREIPWTNVLRFLSLAVPSGIGLTSVTVQNQTISITGETRDPNRIPMFWGAMNRSPFFQAANVTSIQREGGRADGKISFQMTATLPDSSGKATKGT